MGWLRLVGFLKLQVSLAKEPYKRDHVLQKRPVIWSSLLIVATPYTTVTFMFPVTTFTEHKFHAYVAVTILTRHNFHIDRMRHNFGLVRSMCVCVPVFLRCFWLCVCVHSPFQKRWDSECSWERTSEFWVLITRLFSKRSLCQDSNLCVYLCVYLCVPLCLWAVMNIGVVNEWWAFRTRMFSFLRAPYVKIPICVCICAIVWSLDFTGAVHLNEWWAFWREVGGWGRVPFSRI